MFQIREYLRKEVATSDGEQMPASEEMEIVNDILRMEDKDNDGYISHIEFSGSKHDEF